VTTLAGLPLLPGDIDGDNLTAKFNLPSQVAIGIDGAIYILDNNGTRIRVLVRAAAVSPPGSTTPRPLPHHPSAEKAATLSSRLDLPSSPDLFGRDIQNAAPLAFFKQRAPQLVEKAVELAALPFHSESVLAFQSFLYGHPLPLNIEPVLCLELAVRIFFSEGQIFVGEVKGKTLIP
jgi:hypothetical protein